MATSHRPSIDNELASQGASVANVCQVSYCQWPNLFTITSTPRKFAECLNCAVSVPPTSHVMSCSIESPVVCSSYGRSSHIHTFMHQHINTFIYSHIQAYTTHNTHNTNSHMIASVAQSLVWSISLQFSPQLRFIFFFLPSGKSYITDSLRFIFLSSKW